MGSSTKADATGLQVVREWLDVAHRPSDPLEFCDDERVTDAEESECLTSARRCASVLDASALLGAPYAAVVPPSGVARCHPRSVLPDIGDDQAREKVDARSTWSSVGATPV